MRRVSLSCGLYRRYKQDFDEKFSGLDFQCQFESATIVTTRVDTLARWSS
jgi:hypothetical protein